jgi:hypothetical protein
MMKKAGIVFISDQFRNVIGDRLDKHMYVGWGLVKRVLEE